MTELASPSDQLGRLEALVPLCSSIRKGREYGTALAQATSEVFKASDVLARLENLEPALHLLKGTPQMPTAELILDLEKLQVAGHHLEHSASTEALRDVRFLVRDIQQALQSIETWVSKAWTARVQAEFGPLERLARVLAGIPDTKAVGVALQQWALGALGASQDAVPTSDSIRQFERAQAELIDQLKTLGTLGIDIAVRAFLLEVAAEKATLASLTPAVLEWLRAKNAHARFRIRLT